jgi:signal transduction histidine kinase
MNAAIKDQAAALPSHNGIWLRVIRGAWYLLAALALGIFIASLPGFVLLASEELRAGVRSPVLLAFGLLAVVSAILVALLSLSLAWVVFRHAGQDRMALLVSFFLLAHGVTTAGPLEGLEPFLPGAANLSMFVLQPMLLTPLTILIFTVFPDGRFVPPWSRWIVVLAIVLAPLMVIVSPAGPVENLGDVQGALIGLPYISLFVVAAAMIYAQVYRYRRISTPEQRQQTKWVIYGIAVSFLLGALTAGPWLALQSMPPDSPLPGWAPVLSLVWVISIAVFPVSLAIAVLRYRLWDIDIVINRTLVYGLLTAGVVGLYALVVGSAGVLLQSSGNLVGVLLATALAVAAFRPLRSRVQGGVDRLLPATVNRPIGKETPPGGVVGEHTETLAVSAAARQGVSQERGEAMSAQPESNTRLHGPWLAIGRVTWFVLTTLTLVVWAAALPSVAGVLPQLGLPTGFYAVYVGFTAVLMLAYVLLAILIFWRRSDDWFALVVSFAIVSGGASTSWVYHAAYNAQSNLRMLNTFVLLLGSAAPVYLMYTFPDGRFVPRWTRPVFILGLLWVILSILFPDEPFSPIRGTGLSLSLMLITLGTVLAAQIYRYKFVSTSVQRQQTKWVLFGFAAALGLIVVTGFPYLAFPALLDHPMGAFFSIIFWPILYMIIPLTIGLAVLRYRLWDIDVVLNRTLVYGALTAAIVAMYVLLVSAFGALFHSSDNLLVALLATGLAAILFQPLRERLQRGVNRLMYGERDDPYAVLSRLGRRLEASLSPGASLTTIVETVAQALKLPYAAIALDRDARSDIVANYGLPVTDSIRLPLIYRAETIGQLILAPRAPGESFTPAEQRLLENVAQQAGLAAHAVRLTDDLKQLAADLQRSREKLVTAREEERRRLRRDLHDGLGPMLASQTLTLDAIGKMQARDPERAQALLNDLKTQSQAAVRDVRRLVYDLRPPALDDLGLVGALREQAQQYRATGVRFTIDAPPQGLPPLPAAVEVAAYRIAQEAITNVVKHASAQACTVRLNPAETGLTVEVVDDGRGLPVNRHSGVGLQSMRERAAELGGRCLIETRAGGGTRVEAWLPMVQESS